MIKSEFIRQLPPPKRGGKKDWVACGLFAVLALSGLFLPLEICVLTNPDSTQAVFYDIIVDPPTGELVTSTVYDFHWAFLLLSGLAVFFLLRATRPPDFEPPLGIPTHDP